MVLLGALGVLVVEAAIWGGWRLFRGNRLEPATSVEMTKGAASVEVDAADGVVRDVSATQDDEPEHVAAGSARRTHERARVEEAAGADPSPAAANGDRQELTAEERLALRARESAERQTDEAALAAEEDEAERTFWADRFDTYKTMMMATIDGYFECPAEGRFEYLMEKNREFMTQMAADRRAANMPGEIRNPQKVNEQFMQMLAEKMSDDERAKFETYIQDVVKLQMDRLRPRSGDGAGKSTEAPQEP